MNIDKGLDAIISSSSISSGGQRNRTNKRNNTKRTTTTSGKKTSSGNKGNSKGTTTATLTTALNNTNPLFFAKSVIVSNMPFDVDEKAVRDFFSQKIGRVKSVEGSYRDNGTPTGSYTLRFERPGKALQLLEKFDNELVDGKRRLRVQILLTSDIAQAPKPLSERIGSMKTQSTTQKPRDNRQKKTNQKPAKQVAAKTEKAAGKVGKNSKNQKQAQRKSKPKPKKVSAAQLDAEMSDYFAKADPVSNSNDINV